MKNQRFLYTIVGVLAVVAASAALCRPTTTSRDTLSLTVLNQETGDPVAGAWVCVADEGDPDGDGVLNAVSATTNAQGVVEFRFDTVRRRILNVAAPGFGSYLVSYLGTGDRLEVRLVPKSVYTYWGRLAGPTTSGAVIERQLGRRVAVADGTGLFMVAIAKDEFILRARSPFICDIEWKVDRYDRYTRDNPAYIRTVSTTHFDSTIQPLSSSTGHPITCTSVKVWDPVERSWGEARRGASTSWIAEDQTGAHAPWAYGHAGLHWGVSPLAKEGVTELRIGDGASGTLRIESSATPDGPAAGWGTYVLVVDLSSSLGAGVYSPALIERPLPKTGLEILDLTPGTYRITWRRPFGITSKTASITAGQETVVHLTHQRVSSGYTPSKYGKGNCTVRGTVTAQGETIKSADICLSHPDTGEIYRRYELDPATGTYSFTGVAAGSYRITGLGESVSGKTLYQADGAGITELTPGKGVQVDIKLYALPFAIVYAFKSDSEGTTIEPASGAKVSLLDPQSGEVIAQGISDETGSTTITGVPEGEHTYTVVAELAGYSCPQPSTLNLPDGQFPPMVPVILIQD